jgi:RNA polymerase sigma factor (sigma-70 family)
MLSVLVKLFGLHQSQLAEDIVQDTLIAAYESWKTKAIPENPRAWLYRTAKNKAIDVLRKQNRFETQVKTALTDVSHAQSDLDELFLEHEISDAQLRMMFWCCHPALSDDAKIALILKSLCGMSAKEIAIGFMQTEDSIARRIHRAKEKLRDLSPEINQPQAAIPESIDTVLHALYLLFNEGYKSASSEEVIRQDLCMESIRLTLLLAHHPNFSTPKVHALLALMAFQAARQSARINEDGALVPIDEQDRRLWNRELISFGYAHFVEANKSKELSTYHIEAGIASYHVSASSFKETNWPAIVQAYHLLYQMAPNKAVAFNRAVAIGYAAGPEAGIKALEEPILDMNQAVWHVAMADFYVKLCKITEAMTHYQQALTFDLLDQERALILKKQKSAAE